MFKCFSVLLIVFSISTPAYAQNFGFLSSNGGPEHVIDGHAYAPMQSTVVGGSMHGYPFYSGCCEQKSSCCEGLWDGYCGSKSCGMKSLRHRHHGGKQGDCGCGYAEPCGGGKSGGGHLSYRGLGGKGGYGIGGGGGSKGHDACDPCAPKHCRLGLFDWLHFGHGQGCKVCGGAGCSSCGKGGKGGFGKGGYIEHAPMQGYGGGYNGGSYYGEPLETQQESTLQPPEVLVEPTSISDRSAWRRQVPTNPFLRPLGY